VVAANRVDAFARLRLLAGNANPEVISSGFRSRVLFEDLSDHSSGYDRGANADSIYCLVAKIVV
jgi:hypothetical protein